MVRAFPWGALWAVLLTFPGGCFTAQRTTLDALRGIDGTAAVEIELRQGEKFRALVGPTDLTPESLRYRRLRHDPDGWVVRYGGWPIVYTAGRRLRWETTGDTGEVPVQEIKTVWIEGYSWPVTLLTLPLTLPTGIIDFLIHHLRFGFDHVDVGFDSVSRQRPARADPLQAPAATPATPPTTVPAPAPAPSTSPAPAPPPAPSR